jgi:hypothetical protein
MTEGWFIIVLTTLILFSEGLKIIVTLFFQGSGSLLSHLEASSALVSPLMCFQSSFGTPPAFQTSPPFFGFKRQSGSRTKTHINTHLGEIVIPSTYPLAIKPGLLGNP